MRNLMHYVTSNCHRYPPRKRHQVESLMRLSGLEPLNYMPNKQNMRQTFLMIGERCNVAGSSIYKKAIVDGNYDKAAGIATKQVCCCSISSNRVALLIKPLTHQQLPNLMSYADNDILHVPSTKEKSVTRFLKMQVEQGADLLDINMDDGLIEGIGAMTRFVNLLVADPETSRVPFMIDSSKVRSLLP